MLYHMVIFCFHAVQEETPVSVFREFFASLSFSVTDLEPYRFLNDLPKTGEEELTLSTSEIKICKY